MQSNHELLLRGTAILPWHTFFGVFPRDHLPHTIPILSRQLPVSLIYNTDTANLGGTHWIAIVCFPNGYGEVFDSFGRAPSPKVARWMTQHCSRGWDYNQHSVQGPLTMLCGTYCLYYLLYRINTYPIIKSYSQFITKYFGFNNNDYIMQKFDTICLYLLLQ